jgi:hypothetical protein
LAGLRTWDCNIHPEFESSEGQSEESKESAEEPSSSKEEAKADPSLLFSEEDQVMAAPP